MTPGAATKNVKEIKIDGTDATINNIQTGKYKFSATLMILRVTGRNMSVLEKDFLKFVYSREGQNIIAKNGYIHLSNDQIKEEMNF